ncbi:hypothetical protein BaRGS_00020976 [Batillaria attramentaria]|uniref:Mid2 domain-containing protein n=1 Tax=Batillaria attramentaria TaxID=370345 RepID=A0ABD0KKP0_9CAEN
MSTVENNSLNTHILMCAYARAHDNNPYSTPLVDDYIEPVASPHDGARTYTSLNISQKSHNRPHTLDGSSFRAENLPKDYLHPTAAQCPRFLHRSSTFPRQRDSHFPQAQSSATLLTLTPTAQSGPISQVNEEKHDCPADYLHLIPLVPAYTSSDEYLHPDSTPAEVYHIQPVSCTKPSKLKRSASATTRSTPWQRTSRYPKDYLHPIAQGIPAVPAYLLSDDIATNITCRTVSITTSSETSTSQTTVSTNVALTSDSPTAAQQSPDTSTQHTEPHATHADNTEMTTAEEDTVTVGEAGESRTSDISFSTASPAESSRSPEGHDDKEANNMNLLPVIASVAALVNVPVTMCVVFALILRRRRRNKAKFVIATGEDIEARARGPPDLAVEPPEESDYDECRPLSRIASRRAHAAPSSGAQATAAIVTYRPRRQAGDGEYGHLQHVRRLSKMRSGGGDVYDHTGSTDDVYCTLQRAMGRQEVMDDTYSHTAH